MTELINMTIRQFMKYENIGRTNAYKLVHDPSFYPAFRIGKKKILINVEKLKKWNTEHSMN